LTGPEREENLASAFFSHNCCAHCGSVILGPVELVEVSRRGSLGPEFGRPAQTSLWVSFGDSALP